MDAIDIFVEDTELTSLDDDFIFKKGMQCHVADCTYTGNFNNHSKLKEHWNDLHNSTITVHRCIEYARVFNESTANGI